ncbi:MAG: three-Cys-motif partner protein TcmP [Sphingobacteriales bacterium]|nr:three-Cys-motif partner protein TcmP [Sphingobacteriales bacterium]
MSKIKDSQKRMYEHSKAKVDLFARYLSIYLNVISRVPFIKKIYLFDLFAGEGVYLNEEKGSSIITLESIRSHYLSNNKKCPNIDIWFNDSEKSEIDEGVFKIERIERFAKSIFKPENVNVKYTKLEYSEVIKLVIPLLENMKDSERALLFIDPWGYKEIDPKDLKGITDNGKSEVLLFLPISFMYRFADKALADDGFIGGKPLEKFLTELFKDELPDTNNQFRFIEEVKRKFKQYLGVKYVDTFTIERGSKNFFCLFFFTNNKTGFVKMLNAKWDLDEESGRGFRVRNQDQMSFFDEVEVADYLSMIKEFLGQKEVVTNQNLFDFGLTQGFLPPHTKKVLDVLKKNGELELISLDGEKVKGFYLEDNHSRIIQIKLI